MSALSKLPAFKAYDIRGKVPTEFNEDMAYKIGRAFVQLLCAETVVIGRDIRESSHSIASSLIRGITEEGADVIDIGLCGTEQVYFATSHLHAGGGIMVTASHNPIDYNGMKLVREQSKPISSDTGLRDIETMVTRADFSTAATKPAGAVSHYGSMVEYVEHLLTYVNRSALKSLKVVVNAGNGCAGPVIDALEQYLPFEFIKVHHNPDGKFPNGIPNPILTENQEVTAKMVRETGSDVGIAWDGDFDRCFLFDENGCFVEGYYIVGFLAQAFMRKNPGAKIIHDPRLTWNTIEIVRKIGGIPVQSKTGHAFIKERMRLEDAVYGGEMSAHHYFKDFAYCDSGMIPWLLVVEIMCMENKNLSSLLGEMIDKYPASGEINSTVSDPREVLARIEQKFITPDVYIDRTDGLSVEYPDWRFNIRMSNTEPVMRLNVEARGDRELMEQKKKELLSVIRS